MKLNEHSATVAIVGAGPCGLALGLQLVQRGIVSVIFEKNPSLSIHPKAMGMSRRSAEIFRQLGVLDALYEPCRHLVEGPDVCFNIFARSLVGEEWGRIPLTEPVSPLSPGPSFHCPQTLTEKVLFDMLERTSPDYVRFNQKVTAVTAQEKQVEFSAGGERWTADWLIAADGAGGQIRRDLQVESDGPGEMGRFLNVFFKADYGTHLVGRRSLLFSALTEKIAEFFVTVNGNDLWLMHHFLLAGETSANYPVEKLVAIIREASGMPEIPVEVLSISPWVMSPKISRRFRLGRIFFCRRFGRPSVASGRPRAQHRPSIYAQSGVETRGRNSGRSLTGAAGFLRKGKARSDFVDP